MFPVFLMTCDFTETTKTKSTTLYKEDTQLNTNFITLMQLFQLNIKSTKRA